MSRAFRSDIGAASRDDRGENVALDPTGEENTIGSPPAPSIGVDERNRPTSVTKPIIETRAPDSFYGVMRALRGVETAARGNEVAALISPSGCGKSTFLWAVGRTNRTEDYLTQKFG